MIDPGKIQRDLETKLTLMHEHGDVRFVNVTPHEFHMLSKTGEIIVVPPSGMVVNARERLTIRADHGGGVVVKNLTWEEDPVGRIKLNVLKARYPGSVILGSKIAAHGYPGEICFCRKLAPDHLLERRPTAEEKKNPLFYLDSLTIIES